MDVHQAARMNDSIRSKDAMVQIEVKSMTLFDFHGGFHGGATMAMEDPPGSPSSLDGLFFIQNPIKLDDDWGVALAIRKPLNG